MIGDEDLSCFDMGVMFDLITTFENEKIAEDGRLLLDENFIMNMFLPITDQGGVIS